jgi:FixJ family two-component response regulator
VKRTRGLPHSKTLKRPTVLLVDDDPSVLRALGRLIRSAGFEVQTFERPRLLLAAEMPRTNVCLLLDVYMPELNGVELYEALVAAGHSLPLIMITGRDDADTRRLVQRVSAVAVLYKPFGEDLLLDAISQALVSSHQ